MNKDKNKTIPTYKIVMLGASTVGKSSMVNQFVNNFFDALNEETNDDFRFNITIIKLTAKRIYETS
jgi:GTPase SAR1 family protein